MAASAISTSHHASSSLDHEASMNDSLFPEGQAPAFPSLTPLSHDLPLLSPVHNATFSVDEFLLSRTKASDLNFILSDLRSYSEKLKDELYSIINEDYKDFVSLGSSLKSEAHRIARLGWTARSDGEHVAQPGLMAPVRDTLLASRSMLKSVQDDIEECIKRREDASTHKARLELMLQLHDSIVRLEDLLLIQQERSKRDRRRSNAGRPSVLSIGSMGERRGSLASVASGSDQELSDYAMSSEYEEESESESENDDDKLRNGDDHHKRTKRKILRRLSSGTQNMRSPAHARDAATSPTRTRTRSGTVSGTPSSSSSSLLGLPQRIARTSAEYSRLRFLHRRIDEENLTHYADALQDRIDSIRSVLRQDLRTLLRALLSPTSLLVHGQSSVKLPSSPELRKSSRPAAGSGRRTSFLQSLSAKPQTATIHEGGTTPTTTNELDVWTQIVEPVEEGGNAEMTYWEARLEEQRSWLEMVLTTLNTLTLVGEGEGIDARRRNEAEEAVRDLLVSEWAERVIVDKAEPTDDTFASEASNNLPAAISAQFQEHRDRLQSLLLPLPTSPSTPLVDLYNTILTFTSITAYQVIDASREITPSNNCDIFTHVIWETLSTRLLSTMSNTIFFVGQPDTFYTNFTLTNQFLQRFLSLAPTEESKQAMLEHPNWLAFKRRWQLPVYFQMRFREVVTKLESDLVDGRKEVGRAGEGEECMQATRATLEAVEKVWSDGVHIHELSARQWRVTLQLLSRFKSWIEEQSPAELTAGSGRLDALRSTTSAAADGSARSSFDLHQRGNSAEISRVSTPQPPPDAPTQQHEDDQLRLATALLSDTIYLRGKMEVILDDVILPRICANVDKSSSSPDDDDGNVVELRRDLLSILDEDSLDFIPGLTASVGRFAYSIIAPRSAAPLRLLRSFSTPAYRPGSGAGNDAKNGGATAAISVIHQLFSPLESFLSLPATRRISKEIKKSWVEKILTDAFKRYTNTIETINKNQQSLIRLKKSQGGPSQSSSGLLGLFKSTTTTSTDTSESDPAKTNKQALLTFEQRIKNLDLDLPLQHWDAWSTLKNFLESEADQV
ncbi:related to conserved oligomeric Golgi complex component 2 [Ustilago trichophora]|uniref:Conserved oligomeric Golgi complex subunit 2 n=1 Tax=Ustilago trichophora TaxID=86804 RepID=A0A5C3EET2_9BASI|nr:related to conserved oligomeric Golgi complex component 2 [Ustilago trichophora]